MDTGVLIVGGGLSGLYAALRLEQAGADYLLIEARDRLGGRVQGGVSPAPGRRAVFDLGPAWVWPDFQPLIAGLADELCLPLFAQYLAGDTLYEEGAAGPVSRSSAGSAMHGSYRFRGGTSALIDALAARIPAHRVRLATPLHELRQHEGWLEAHVGGPEPMTGRAQQVLLTPPPRLIGRALRFLPALPEALHRAFVATPTWMAGHAKIVALYETAFWRAQGLSGEAFSRRGPMTEIHDASPEHGGPYALFGFVGYPPAARAAMGETALLDAARQQLQRLFGRAAAAPFKVLFKDWAQDEYTATRDDLESVGRHPDYGLPAQAVGLWSGRLAFASTELAPLHGGYLEGALAAADAALRYLSDDPGAAAPAAV